MPFPNSLPQELIDAIVDYLPADTTNRPLDWQRDLTACALVSRSFSAPARRRLFNTIHLTTFKATSTPGMRNSRPQQELIQRVRALSDLLAEETSDLIHLMHTLLVEIDHEGAMFDSSAGLDVVLWLVSTGARNLETLHFESADVLPCQWNSLVSDIRESLSAICHSKSIRNLQFANLTDLPTNILTDCSSLHLRNVTLSPPIASPSTLIPGATVIHLEELQLSSRTPGNWDHFASIIPIISGVKTLKLWPMGYGFRIEDFSAFTKILRNMSDSLITLEITFLRYSLDVLNLVPSSPLLLHPLHNISLRFTRDDGSRMLPDMKRAVELLNRLITPTDIRTITLDFSVVTFESRLDGFIRDKDEGLASLGLSILEDKFPLLQKLTFKLQVGFFYSRDLDPIHGQNYARETARSIEEGILSLMVPSASKSQYDSARSKINVVVTVQV
ncbi:hypothetical protein GALMADRAFT_144571 [Galerina marginata CBS 339.88]|uniref:F-box domain-containing protein n=1 Tax=Galerina marginata (strain CBS 339.88) TaxID=685588 RepID=A0A067SID8_GALM3|nr:hypothetical protein GALMADRAFT_144571 [Galerina marginata CBS 339.88]